MIIALTAWTVFLSITTMYLSVYVMRTEGVVFKVLGAGAFIVGLSLLLFPAEHFGLIPRMLSHG